MIKFKEGFPFISHWVAIENVDIATTINPISSTPHDMFSFIGSPTAKSYNPFDYYYSPIPEEIISAILGPRTTLQNNNLYTLFASLDPSNTRQIQQWVKYFGPPRYINQFEKDPLRPSNGFHTNWFLSSDNFIDTSPNKQWDIAPLQLIRTDIYAFKGILKLFTNQELTEKESNAITYSAFQDEYYSVSTAEKITTSISNPNATIKQFQNFIFSENKPFVLTDYLSKIQPRLVFKNDNYQLVWDFYNLISAMYFMFTLDLASNKAPIQCQNALCKRFFIPRRPRALYCSDTCQNRAKQQRHRDREKEKPKEGDSNAKKN
ncbi:CGNR zinc finger domain-containing protein [Anaeroarcus burkinensis]|uniref:CGNR zinc finger domain-containing protein n=1 Tax=Anaeroarcus burkinensis TaxID=82376 RepID=UPI000427677C|nr:CGNR zinc finger domain-containing protein [Anaeroarcus burkinensis]